MRFAFLFFLLLTALPATAAIEPGERLADPALEMRARTLFKEVRCLVCQSESIDTSNADLARDLRILVRERLKAGDTDQEALDYLVARYGDYVLLRPPLKLETVLLWFGPFLALFLGAGAVLYFARRERDNPDRAAAPLSAEERARLAQLVERELRS
ncbi:MAG: cytochrome c-type biogenesis protein CcmH [Rhodospirillales bacterium]